MRELEPTRTYSNPTATEVLRRLLDEAGVEWHDDGYATTCTVWTANGIVWHGLWRDGRIELIAHLTPEQSIAATLGPAARHPKPHEKWTTVLHSRPNGYEEWQWLPVREEIVRCRDCEHYEWREHLGRSYCCGEYPTEPDGFCAWGERKESE